MQQHDQDISRDVLCPNCRGVVNVPKEVKWSERTKQYRPLANCRRCLRGYSWHSAKNPVMSYQSVYNGLVDKWFSDCILNAPAPKVVDNA